MPRDAAALRLGEHLRKQRLARTTVRAVALVFLSLASAAVPQAQQSPSDDPNARSVIRMLQDVSRALQAGNPSSFLRFFDRKQFASYAALESQIVALTTQSDVASSIDVVQIDRASDGYRVRVDWLLQLTVKETPGPLETRRDVLPVSAIEVKPGSWKIISLEPVNFFRPQGSRQP